MNIYTLKYVKLWGGRSSTAQSWEDLGESEAASGVGISVKPLKNTSESLSGFLRINPARGTLLPGEHSHPDDHRCEQQGSGSGKIASGSIFAHGEDRAEARALDPTQIKIAAKFTGQQAFSQADRAIDTLRKLLPRVRDHGWAVRTLRSIDSAMAL
jgi:hypothetical protein